MLKMRIQILKNGGIIGEDVAAFMEQVIDMMAADYPQIPHGPCRHVHHPPGNGPGAHQEG